MTIIKSVLLSSVLTIPVNVSISSYGGHIYCSTIASVDQESFFSVSRCGRRGGLVVVIYPKFVYQSRKRSVDGRATIQHNIRFGAVFLSGSPGGKTLYGDGKLRLSLRRRRNRIKDI